MTMNEYIPESLADLEREIERKRKDYHRMNAANGVIKRNQSNGLKKDELALIGFKDSAIVKILTNATPGKPYFSEKLLVKLAAEIASLEGRLDEERAKIEVSVIGTRLRVVFPSRPTYEVTGLLKMRGFRWLHDYGAWEGEHTEANFRFAESLKTVKAANQ